MREFFGRMFASLTDVLGRREQVLSADLVDGNYTYNSQNARYQDACDIFDLFARYSYMVTMHDARDDRYEMAVHIHIDGMEHMRPAIYLVEKRNDNQQMDARERMVTWIVNNATADIEKLGAEAAVDVIADLREQALCNAGEHQELTIIAIDAMMKRSGKREAYLKEVERWKGPTMADINAGRA